MVDEAQGSYKE